VRFILSDIKISLPGSETVTISGQTIDKLIRAGDGDAALLYLYILKTHGQKTSSEAAIALDKNKGWINSAMAVLSRLGLVQLETDVNDAGGVSNGGVASGGSDDFTVKEPRKHTVSEIKAEMMAGSDFSIVVDETQRRLGKLLTEDDLLRLFGIYDTLRLPPEVIMQLITHCIKESRYTGDGRAVNVRYIEKAAYTWEREGLFTLEKAEEYLKALDAKKSLRGEIKKILQIRNREFSPTEKKYIDDWIAMGFESEAIAIAYDKTITATGNLAYQYMDKILFNWDKKGLHTAEKITENEGNRKQGTGMTAGGSGLANGVDSKAGVRSGDKKHGEPNREEQDRMRRLLNKIKEE